PRHQRQAKRRGQPEQAERAVRWRHATSGGEPRDPEGSALLQEGVEKPVVIVLCADLRWQELPLQGRKRIGQLEWNTRSIEMPSGKGFNLLCVLGPENRACRIEKSAASRERRPQCIEQLPLLFDKARDIAFAPQPFYVWVTAHDARCGAWRVEQNSLEGHAVPPRSGIPRIAGDKTRRQTEAREIFADAFESVCIEIDRGEVGSGELGKMRSLAAGCRTGIEHTHT